MINCYIFQSCDYQFALQSQIIYHFIQDRALYVIQYAKVTLQIALKFVKFDPPLRFPLKYTRKLQINFYGPQQEGH